MKTLILATTVLLISFHAAIGAPPSLKDAVGPKLFAEAGLEKLTPEEQARLVEGLSNIFEDGENPFFDPEEKDQRFGFSSIFQRRAAESHTHEPDEIISSLSGPFDGWDGNEVFRLDNGQIWKQAEGGRFSVNMDSPTVIISKGVLGVYFLKVEGYGKRVKVKRIK